MEPVEGQRCYLPNRRVALHEVIDFNGMTFRVCVGFDARGGVREIFTEDLSQGSDLDKLMQDASILISMLLQHGYSIERLFAKIMRVEISAAGARFDDECTGAQKPSLIAAVLGAALNAEREHGARIEAAFRGMDI